MRPDEFDSGVREAEIAMSATVLGHGAIVCEMSGQLPTQAAVGGDEVDDALDALHVAFFSGFDLRVDGGDDSTFCLFALWEVFEDAEAVHNAAYLEFDGA